MTQFRIFRAAPALLAATLAFAPTLAGAQAVTPSTPLTQPSREAPGAPAPVATTAPTPNPAPAAKHAAARKPAMKPTERVEERINDLHAKLKITPAQAPQWNAFAEVMRANAQGMETAYEARTTGRQKMTAVENMQSYATIADQHAADLRKLAPAFAEVYRVMSDDQKRNADTVFRAPESGGTRRSR
jgi:protein CpxP